MPILASGQRYTLLNRLASVLGLWGSQVWRLALERGRIVGFRSPEEGGWSWFACSLSLPLGRREGYLGFLHTAGRSMWVLHCACIQAKPQGSC